MISHIPDEVKVALENALNCVHSAFVLENQAKTSDQIARAQCMALLAKARIDTFVKKAKRAGLTAEQINGFLDATLSEEKQ